MGQPTQLPLALKAGHTCSTRVLGRLHQGIAQVDPHGPGAVRSLLCPAQLQLAPCHPGPAAHMSVSVLYWSHCDFATNKCVLVMRGQSVVAPLPCLWIVCEKPSSVRFLHPSSLSTITRATRHPSASCSLPSPHRLLPAQPVVLRASHPVQWLPSVAVSLPLAGQCPQRAEWGGSAGPAPL